MNPPPSTESSKSFRHLRVLVLCDAAPDRNGVGSYYSDLTARMQLSGVKVEFIHPVSTDNGGYCFLGLPMPGDYTQRLALPRIRRVLSVVDALQPHVIIVPTPGPFGLLGLFLAKRLNLPLIAGFHTHYEALTELYWQHPLQRPFGLMCRGFLEHCNRSLFRRANLVLANSPETARAAEMIGADDVAIMGTSVSLDYLQRSPVPLREVSASDDPRIVFAGRLAREKNVYQLIELAKQCPTLRVVIAGDGPERDQVHQAALRLDNLEYLGWVHRAMLADVLDSADVVVLPSVVESFGTVALEALARARPVLVSQGCGIVEWDAFESALFVARTNEPLKCAVQRVLCTPLSHRISRVNAGRLAVIHLDQWNVESWLERIAALPQRATIHADSLDTKHIVSH